MIVKTTKSQQLILTAIAAIMCAYAFYANTLCTLLASYDTGWIIQTGNYILQHGIPNKDIFSWTNNNCPLIAYQWLFSVMLALLFHAGSLWLVGLSACLLVGILVFFVLANNWIGKGIPAFVPLFVLALTLTPNWFNARPQLCSYFLLYAFIAILERYRISQAQTKWLFALPLLMILWVNLHSFCFIGLLIIAIYFACQSLQKRTIDRLLLIALGLSILATLVNPYGIGLPMHIWSFIDSSQYLNIWELMPWLNIQQFTWTILFVPLVIAIVIAFRKQIPLEGYVLMALSMIAALSMRRFEPVFVIVSWQYLGLALSSINWSTQPSQQSRKPSMLALASFIVPIVAWYLQCPNQTQAWIVFTEGAYPFLSTACKYTGRQEHIFAPPSVGSWLIAMGNYPVFIDTRFDMYPKDFIHSTNNCLEGGKESLENLDKWKITKLFTKDDYLLTMKLLSSADWMPVLDDGAISWWIRRSDNTEQQLHQWQLSDSELTNAHLPPYIITSTIEFRGAKYLQLAKTYRQLQDMNAAREAISKGLELMPQSPALLKEQELCQFATNATDIK